MLKMKLTLEVESMNLGYRRTFSEEYEKCDTRDVMVTVARSINVCCLIDSADLACLISNLVEDERLDIGSESDDADVNDICMAADRILLRWRKAAQEKN